MHYTWRVAGKGFKIAFMINTLAMTNSCEIILEFFFAKNHCEIQVHTILVRPLYSIKYNTQNTEMKLKTSNFKLNEKVDLIVRFNGWNS